MSDYSETADILTSSDAIETTVEIDGDELPIKVQDVRQSELDALDEEVAGEAGGDAAKREAIDRYLIEPDIGPEDIPMRKQNLLWMAMSKAWGGIDDIQPALEELNVEGNR